MPAQAHAVTEKMLEPWTRWQGETINQTFTLQRLLGRSDHGVSFLTNRPDGSDATIKIVPAALAPVDVQLTQWRTAAALSHPQLIRIFDLGRGERDGQPYLFIAMEYAQETLAEVLPQRALSADEVRGLLPAVLDALAFLHRNKLLHGQLKPTNILVVNDELKLTSDSVRPAGDATTGFSLPSPYDPPEFNQGRVSPASDIWALGITLVEALSQHPVLWDEEHSKSQLPDGLPSDLSELIQRCLSRHPEHRPSAQQLQAFIRGDAPLPEAPVAPAVVATTPPASAAREPVIAPPHQFAAPKRSWIPFTALVMGAALVVGWYAVRHAAGPSSAPSTDPTTVPASQTTPTVQPALAAPVTARSSAANAAAIVHQVVPSISRSASETIHGHFSVVVRVRVNSAGNVIDSSFDQEGPSEYFARQASSAARQWKFSATQSVDVRTWVLRFDFRREQATVQADPAP